MSDINFIYTENGERKQIQMSGKEDVRLQDITNGYKKNLQLIQILKIKMKNMIDN